MVRILEGLTREEGLVTFQRNVFVGVCNWSNKGIGGTMHFCIHDAIVKGLFPPQLPGRVLSIRGNHCHKLVCNDLGCPLSTEDYMCIDS